MVPRPGSQGPGGGSVSEGREYGGPLSAIIQSVTGTELEEVYQSPLPPLGETMGVRDPEIQRLREENGKLGSKMGELSEEVTRLQTDQLQILKLGEEMSKLRIEINIVKAEREYWKGGCVDKSKSLDQAEQKIKELEGAAAPRQRNVDPILRPVVTVGVGTREQRAVQEGRVPGDSESISKARMLDARMMTHKGVVGPANVVDRPLFSARFKK